MEEKNLDDRRLCQLGKKCLDYGFYQTATDCYIKALEINPDSSDAKIGLESILEIKNKNNMKYKLG